MAADPRESIHAVSASDAAMLANAAAVEGT